MKKLQSCPRGQVLRWCSPRKAPAPAHSMSQQPWLQPEPRDRRPQDGRGSWFCFIFLKAFSMKTEPPTNIRHFTELTKSNHEFWHFALVSSTPVQVMLWDSGGSRASREPGCCLSWKAAHKPNVSITQHTPLSFCFHPWLQAGSPGC